MTDEEISEEYAIKITDELRSKGFLSNEEIDQRYAGIVQGVLFGLTEGKPKWHDLRKDSNDLPKGDEDCLCLVSECYFVGHYVREDKEWHFDEFRSNRVIAWCEISKFEEE